VTVVILIVLVFAGVGVWLVISFVAYRRFFRAVNAILSRMKIGSLYEMSNADFMRYDDVVKRSYFAKKSVSEAVDDVLNEVIVDRNPGALSGKL
jgi:hypothetical protein